MNDFKIYFDNGQTLKTGFNGSLADAQAYYVGRVFNLGHIKDVMTKGVKVEALEW